MKDNTFQPLQERERATQLLDYSARRRVSHTKWIYLDTVLLTDFFVSMEREERKDGIVIVEENGEERYRKQEEEYRNQIASLEEEQITLREAWTEIVRSNMATVDDLKLQLIEAQNERDEAVTEFDSLEKEHEEKHNALASELAATKLSVAQLSEDRDIMHRNLVSLLRTIPSSQDQKKDAFHKEEPHNTPAEGHYDTRHTKGTK